MRAIVLGSIFLIWFCGTCVFAAEEPLPLDCFDPFKSAPAAVKQTLGHFYRTEASGEQLQAASQAMRELGNAATACRVAVQAPGVDHNLSQEWISLHMWINRIADFMYLNARGRNTVNWKDEYADFASLYEIDV